jgi:hypothetical protein
LAATLFKLAINATATTTVETKPNVQKLFYTFNPADISNGDLVIAAAKFVDDAGNTATTIPELETDNGYYLLFINGVLQQDSLYTITDTDVTIPDIANLGDIPDDAPITLIVTNFEPEATSQITVET